MCEDVLPSSLHSAVQRKLRMTFSGIMPSIVTLLFAVILTDSITFVTTVRSLMQEPDHALGPDACAGHPQISKGELGR